MAKGYKGGYTSLGKSLINSNHLKRVQSTASRAGLHTVEYGGNKNGLDMAPTSVLERGDLDEFVTTAALARAEFEAERRPDIVTHQTVAISKKPTAVRSYGEDLKVRVLRRPLWSDGMTSDQLTVAENEAFLEWRKRLAHLEEMEGLCLSPFEKNIDFWRQLWRTVERSSIIVQILDARDPLFFFCEDLFAYVDEVARDQGCSKRKILLLNKADYVPAEARAEWHSYFADAGYEVHFFSALSELTKQVSASDNGELRVSSELPNVGLYPDGADVLDCGGLLDVFEAGCHRDEKVVVGMTGFPNVGKSTLINAVIGSKRVSMSRQPGKTKHIQTLELSSTLTLCDCPGIVMPSVVSSKAHLVVNGTVSLDHIRDYKPAVALVVSRVGIKKLLAHYGCEAFFLPEFRKQGESRGFLCAYAVSRKYFLRLNLPDEFKAAKILLKDFCDGRVPHHNLPPLSVRSVDVDEKDIESESSLSDDDELAVRAKIEDSKQELVDISRFMASVSAPVESDPTKRAIRMQAKKVVKSGRRFTAEIGGMDRSRDEVKLPAVKPGHKNGRMARALEDPYGCHRADEHFI